MQFISILFSQILLMFLYIFIGVYLFKTKKLSLEGSKSLGNILLYLIMPSVVLKAYMAEFTMERFKGLGIAFCLSILALLLAMIFSHFVFKNKPVKNFGASFSNAGFIGIPIVAAIYGDEAVFYVSSFVGLLNLLQWTYGVFIITKDPKNISMKKIFTNPILISLVIGLVLFFTQLPLGNVIPKAINGIAALNAPLAMFSLGTYLAQISFKDIFTSKSSYLCAFLRLIIIPLGTIAILSLVPNEYLLMKQAILIVASTPVGSNVAIFAQLFNSDYQAACKDVCLSTLLSIFSIPLIFALAGLVW